MIALWSQPKISDDDFFYMYLKPNSIIIDTCFSILLLTVLVCKNNKNKTKNDRRCSDDKTQTMYANTRLGWC